MQAKEDISRKLQDAATGVTLQQLSEKTGLDKGNISKILTGKANPNLENLLKVTNALGKQIEFV